MHPVSYRLIEDPNDETGYRVFIANAHTGRSHCVSY